MATCPCVCHQPEVITEDLRRQMAEEDAAVVRRIRETSLDVSGALDWAELARRPIHQQLETCRATMLGSRSDTRPTDKVSLEHWVQTGEAW